MQTQPCNDNNFAILRPNPNGNGPHFVGHLSW